MLPVCYCASYHDRIRVLGSYYTISYGSSTEVFRVDSNGNAFETFTVPKVYRTKNLVSAVTVTVEDAVSPQKHEGVPILMVRL